MQTTQRSSLGILTLGAIGVVFGDIGTSPLYALKESFHAAHGLPISLENVLGILSMIFWSLMLVVSLKYVAVIMRAHNNGEGGIMALLALITGAVVTRYGAAYAGYPDALALRSPRLAGVFVVAVLVATGTPPFAGFFAWVALVLAATPAMAMGLLAVWLVWSWAAIRLMTRFRIRTDSQRMITAVITNATTSTAMG